jgi:branched-chain amino acid transport system permease protein
VLGAALFTWLEDAVSREVAYWRAAIGFVILLLVLSFPHGLEGAVSGALRRWRSR